MSQRTRSTTILTRGAATRGRVLVVDDHLQARESMCDILRRVGHDVENCSSAVEALALLDDTSFDLVVTDLRMPGLSGVDLVREMTARQCGVQVVLVTAYASVSTAVEAIRLGAFDYIEKPFTVEQLEQLVARALEHGRRLDRGARLAPSAAPGQAPVMVGDSAAMLALRARIVQVGRTCETVLITGESGTGKELIARAVHAASARAARPLVSLNCPVLSAQLLESELFGHERGAFTGAEAQRTGRFELADGSAILLDEITEIDLSVQAKLLRVLQERSFERVGSSTTVHVDVRVIATTNRNLRQEVAAGRFREDLYFRLAVVPLQAPPLRERAEDVPALVNYFLARAAERLDREPCLLTAGALQLLVEYHWPGNVRELENIVTRASVLNLGGPVTPDELRPWLIDAEGRPGAATESVPVGISLHEMERKLIEATLERYDGHRARTAQALGIGIRTLSGKLKDYGYAPRAKSLARSA